MLSGSQAQILGMARILYKNPKILILYDLYFGNFVNNIIELSQLKFSKL